jgi:hypothetical protein
MVRKTSDLAQIQQNPVSQVPIVDFRFNARGDRSFRAFGLETHRFRANEEPSTAGTPAAEINWWIVGSIAAVAIAVIANDERKSKNQTGSSVTGSF